jgi:Virulence factor BrkB
VAGDSEQDWVWLTPGSIFATTLWLIASLTFKYYVVNISSYAATYGAIGGVMVLMLWLYMGPAAMRAWPAAAAAMTAPAPPKLRSSAGGSDWLLGIAVSTAQFWMTLKALRKTRA